MNEIFDWCVQLLLYWARMIGITYKEINVWVFVILWPIFTLALLVLVYAQQRKIQQLQKQVKEGHKS